MRAHACRAEGAGAGAPGAGTHVCRAPGAVQECRAPGAGAHVCRAAGAGAGAGAGASAAGAGAGAGTGAGPSPLITVHPPTKLYFRQSRATPEPQKLKKYIKRYRNHPGGQKCYLPGMILEKYGIYTVCIWFWPTLNMSKLE